MSSEQEYELKIGVFHHASLKTTQLLEFLSNETSDFLSSELPQSLMVRETFYANFQTLLPNSPYDRTEYVGFILLYNSSSPETLQYAQDCAPEYSESSDDFTLLVEMDNSERKMNVVGEEGEEWGRRNGMLFVRLTLYNSDDLVATLNRSIYMLIENFYYPNEEDRQREQPAPGGPSQGQEFTIDYHPREQTVTASQEERTKLLGMIEMAAAMRTSREQEIVAEQSAIDESIENVEKMLNNLNKRIRQKMDSDWFSHLRDSLYKPIEKESRSYNKSKLSAIQSN